MKQYLNINDRWPNFKLQNTTIWAFCSDALYWKCRVTLAGSELIPCISTSLDDCSLRYFVLFVFMIYYPLYSFVCPHLPCYPNFPGLWFTCQVIYYCSPDILCTRRILNSHCKLFHCWGNSCLVILKASYDNVLFLVSIKDYWGVCITMQVLWSFFLI